MPCPPIADHRLHPPVSMTYRTVYDVLEDGWVTSLSAAPIMLAGAIAWTAIWYTLHRVVRELQSRHRERRFGLTVGCSFIALALLMLIASDYRGYVDQQQCKAWRRAGAYETVDGPVVDFYRVPGKPPVHYQFRVAGVQFRYLSGLPGRGGFQGRFTATDAQTLQLHDGLPVRIGHRNGQILYLAVGEP